VLQALKQSQGEPHAAGTVAFTRHAAEVDGVRPRGRVSRTSPAAGNTEKGKPMSNAASTDPNYRCARCKEEQLGPPAFTNAAGVFCATCKADIHRLAGAGAQARIAALNGACVWCGKPIAPEERQRFGCGDNVHAWCANNGRDWMLGCIRSSDHLAKYVQRVEEREGPLREARKAEAQAKLPLSAESVPNTTVRLDRVETLLAKLADALGVK